MRTLAGKEGSMADSIFNKVKDAFAVDTTEEETTPQDEQFSSELSEDMPPEGFEGPKGNGGPGGHGGPGGRGRHGSPGGPGGHGRHGGPSSHGGPGGHGG